MKPLTELQSALLAAIPDDGEWHRFPLQTRSQTILSLVARKAIKLRSRPGLHLSVYYQINYSTAYEAMRI